MSDDLHTDTPLPGLGDPPSTPSAMETAARRSIKALAEQGLLGEEHAMTCQLVLELADVVASGRQSRKAAAAAMAAAQLLGAWETLPKPAEGGDDDDAWSELVEELRAAGRAADARHPTQP